MPTDQQFTQFTQEVKAKQRFEFGKNWTRFLDSLDEGRIQTAEESLRKMLERQDLTGLRFLDIGCGSGLFSLAARRLGASVHSFDFDSSSVACANTLRDRFFPNDKNWTVEQGSALDPDYVKSLGPFEIVYSWGVLHHTGKMWEALDNASLPVMQNGNLFISIYNDQGTASRRWTTVKRLYNQSPGPLRTLIASGVLVQQWWHVVLKDFLLLRPMASWRNYRKARGMNPWRDIVDWAGGYPFEVARPEQIFDFYRERGFRLTKLKTCGGALGCNEFVFVRDELSGKR